MAMAPDTPPEIKAEVEKFNAVQKEINDFIEKQTTLASQHHENTMVKEEFGRLGDEESVFKKIGPVLVKQELSEAKSDVQHRLDFIDAELVRTEELLRAAREKQGALRDKILELQKKHKEGAKV